MNKLQKNLHDLAKGVKRLGTSKVLRKLPAFVVAVICFLSIPVLTFAIGKILISGAVKGAILYQFGFNGKVSGRMDGNVMMRNGRGRGMTIPALVRNTYTSLQRGYLSTFSSGWRALTVAQQNSWLGYKFTKNDRFAMPYDVKGKEAYISSNQNLANIGVAAISTAPAPAGSPDEILSNLTTAATIKYDVSGTSAALDYLVYATPGMSAGINRPGKSAFRLLGKQPAPVLGTVDITTIYSAKYGSVPAVGSKYFVYTVAVNKTTGEAGAGSGILSDIA